jgi:D-3-phosphoglycerate dehydrogenase
MAAVDVFEDEPMRDPNHPLLQMDNVICTPHLGYVERQQYEGMYRDQIDRMEAFFAHRPEGIVNLDVLGSRGTAGRQQSANA